MDAEPNRVVLVVGAIGWFAVPYACAFLLIGFTTATWALAQGLAMVGGTVLLVLLAWLAPRYLLIPLASMVGTIVVWWLFGWGDGGWPGRLLVDRSEPWLLATAAAWTGVLAVAAWLSRAHWTGSLREMLDEQRADDQVTPPAKGRLRRRLAPYRTALNRIGTGLTIAVAVVATASMLWLTTLNIGYAVASEPATLDATIDDVDRDGAFSWYVTTENGRRVRLHQDDAIARDRDAFGRSPGKGGLYRGCYFREEPLPGDLVTFAGRHGPYGFAVDRVLKVSQDGRRLCDGDRERARRAELQRAGG
ncbi:hypothetical protein [Amycolatopsis aidingensis]|uniref:hypothetical protein n=1 Tax=Amycolatopsis aidingensis TaxID=2842453 RepID=UPI001C0D1283|nr:hypothetical protein [Amycolatopsis aidingensis]